MKRRAGFSLLEVIVGMAVLALLILLIGQLFNGATAVSGLGAKRMDADTQARAVLDRMGLDFAQIIRRPDVDYFLKDDVNVFPGNDIMAFYSQVPGYHSTTSSGQQSPFSVTGYRVNAKAGSPSNGQLERYGRGLPWNGVASEDAPLVFSATSRSSGVNNRIAVNWPAATDSALEDRNHDVIGSHLFRFEYFYLLKGRSDTTPPLPTVMSNVPWDTRAGVAHTSVEGMRDVAAICVIIALIDSRSRELVTETQLTTLAAGLNDFDPSTGSPETQWREKLNEPVAGMPVAALRAIRIYSRYYSLSPGPELNF